MKYNVVSTEDAGGRGDAEMMLKIRRFRIFRSARAAIPPNTNTARHTPIDDSTTVDFLVEEVAFS